MKPLRRTHYEPTDVGQFIRLAYWGTWDRIVAVEGSWVAVVSLTPINMDWEHDQAGEVRQHCTSPEGNLLTLSLPEVVEEEIRAHGLGWVLDAQPGELLTRLLEGEIEDNRLNEMLRNAAS